MKFLKAISPQQRGIHLTPRNCGPLTGTRILDLSRILAGPYCTQLLGDLGADVIKVEKVGEGDGSRKWGPPFVGTESTYFMSINRNKRSIAIDMSKNEGKKIIIDLIKKSDVLVENFLPGTLNKLGFSYEVCRQINPIRPGFDIIISAMYGMMHITGEEGGKPGKPGVAVTDVMTGLQAYGAILAALLERSTSGLGQHIETSLMEAQLSSLVNIAGSYLMTGKEPSQSRWGSGHPSIVPYQSFRCQDELDIVVGIGSDSQFKSLCEVLGCSSLSLDAKFSTNASRVKNRSELLPLLSQYFSIHPREHWESLFEKVNTFPFGPVRSIAEAFEDPQAQARDMTPTIQHPTCGGIRVVGHPVKYSRTPATLRSPPPLLGEHTRDVLQNLLGYNEQETELLLDQRIVE